MFYLINTATLAVLALKTLALAEANIPDGEGDNFVIVENEAGMSKLDTATLIRMYNAVRPERPVTRFADRATAEKRVWPVLEYLADTNPKKESITMPAKKAKKSATKKVAKSNGESKRGRTSKYSGKVINKLVDKNPRKEGTSGHKSWSLIRNGMPYDAYIAAGGVRRDLEWDLAHKWVELKSA